MPGTRTAPAINGTPAYQLISFHYIDYSGDRRSVSVQTGAGVANSALEALADNMQDYSNASLWKVGVEAVYAGDMVRANALAEVYPSVYDNVVILYKTADNRSQNIFIPAPTEEIQPQDQDTPDTATLITFNLVALPVLNGTPSIGYTARSARFTERREKNQSVPI